MQHQSVHIKTSPTSTVYYRYGTPSAGSNAGKLIKLQDATGVSDFEYGNMGEVISQTRMHILPNGEWLTHKTLWEYDSWGRTKNITYPDGEKVFYLYNNAGNLRRVETLNTPITSHAPATPYIKNIFYNVFEQKDSVVYGNNTKVKYLYDNKMQRLKEHYLYSANNDILFHKTYSYDSIGNIDSLRDNLVAINENLFSHYFYDSDNRLEGAIGNRYTLDMAYSPAGRVTYKSLTGTGINNAGTVSLNFDNSYRYDQTNNPYAVREMYKINNFSPPTPITTQQFIWDNAGNLCFKKDMRNAIGIGEHFYWTEDNRMQAYYNANGETAAFYRYDASGQRDLKLTGQAHNVNLMGRIMQSPDFRNATLYASPLMTINKEGYVKHYFAENERILSSIGGGGTSLVDEKTELVVITRETLGTLSKILTTFVSEYLWQANKPSCQENGVYRTDLSKLVPLQAAFGKALSQNIADVPYYFHADHLSGASMITNGAGLCCQALAYCPYGEILINMKIGALYDEPYKFTGYERDAESGLDYASARYKDLNVGFITTDPMWSKYPSHTPYHYCLNNPIMLVDPDGNSPKPSGVRMYFASFKMGVGIGYALSTSHTSGVAYDGHGTTHFITASNNYISNQNLHEESQNPSLFLGAEVGLSGGFAYNRKASSFPDAVASQSMETSIGGKGAIGGSIGFGKETVSLSLGIGLGVSIDIGQMSVLESISLSKSEAKQVSKMTNVVTESWFVGNVQTTYGDDGNVSGYKGTVYTKDADGKKINSGIEVKCGATKSNSGIVPNKIWTSSEYDNK